MTFLKTLFRLGSIWNNLPIKILKINSVYHIHSVLYVRKL
jgi:hypothetical protein